MRGSQLDGLVQPDRRTCGSSTLVAARLINDPAYAAWLDERGSRAERFGQEALAVHQQTCRCVDSLGRLHMPWPRALGTSPWSLSRHLSVDAGVPGTTYETRLILPHQRGSAFDALHAAVTEGHAVPLYVGNRLSPRHVVLAIDATPQGVTIYDPAHGHRCLISRGDYLRGRLDVAGWRVPWLLVLPQRSHSPRAA
jgi:hypothetical protein